MTLDDAKEQAVKYGGQIPEMRLQSTPRNRVAFACFAIAHQHHSAILMLLDRPSPLTATAFALLRPTLEATLRGEWVLHCATDEQIKSFALGGTRQLDMASVIQAIERVNPGSDAHKILYKDNWHIVSAYTHSFEHPIQHWLFEEEVSPQYSTEQMAWLLTTATCCFRLCVSSILSLKAPENDSVVQPYGRGDAAR
jgi:hypothetical protein